MFVENKYSKCYRAIIERAKNRIIEDYTEKHHIIPKSLGGSDSKDNLVRLTGREHFICHLLLVRMTEGQSQKKMIYAAWAFVRASKGQQRKKITGRQYEILRKQFVQMMVDTKHGSWNKGRPVSEETRKKLSLVSKGRKRSAETRERMSAAFMGRTPWNKNSTGLYEHSDETRKKMSKAKQEMTPDARAVWVGKMSENRKGTTSAYDLTLQKVVRVNVEEFRQYKNVRYVGLNSKLRPK